MGTCVAENLVDIIHNNAKEMVESRHTIAQIAQQSPHSASTESKQRHGNGTHV